MKWHYLPEKPDHSCYCILRKKNHEFSEVARFTKYPGWDRFSGWQEYIPYTHIEEDNLIEDKSIECWCELEEIVRVLDGKE